MTFWIAAAVLTAAILLLVLRPLIRRPQIEPERSAYDREVYRDQLAELDRELAQGRIGTDQFAAAKTEIGRRILSTAGKPGDEPRSLSGSGRVLAATLSILIPLGALAAYLALGSPGLPSQPFASRERPPEAPPAVAEAVAKLARHLERQPDDAEGWRLLGESYKRMGRLRDSVPALRRAAGLSPGSADVRSSLGEALTWAEDGIVSGDAQQAFEAALKIDAKEPRARYYLALGRAQSGDVRGALDLWLALARDAAVDAPWLPNVRQQITEAARQLKLDARDLLPPTAARPGLDRQAPNQPAPNQQAIEAAQAMTPEQRAGMIRGMVDGLAARLKSNPDDLDGWLRLGRSYAVLGERALAADAYTRAAALAPSRTDVLTALLAELDPQSPEHAEVRQRLDALKQGG